MGQSIASTGGFYSNRQRRKAPALLALGDDGVEMGEHFGDGCGVNLAAGVVALFNQLLEVAAGDLGGELIGDDFAGALLLLEPGLAGQGDPHRASVHVEADVDGVGVPRGDGHDIGLPRAVQVRTTPAVDHVKVFVHVISVSVGAGLGQERSRTELAYSWLVQCYTSSHLLPIRDEEGAHIINSWSSFFSAQVSASAALIGLLFVAISINLRQIVDEKLLTARAAKALFTLSGVLLVSICSLVPNQPPRILGVELILIGVAAWLAATRSQHAASHRNPYVSRKLRVLHGLITQLGAIPFVVGGASLAVPFWGGLDWLVVGTIFSYVSALIDAWVLLIEIQR